MKKEQENRIYGLIGKDIAYSFSRNYFNTKFKALAIENCQYVNFDFTEISEVATFIQNIPKEVRGLNVTIPYKEQIMPFLDEISIEAEKIGAVNCIEITDDGKKIGHNTDWMGFTESLAPLWKEKSLKGLVLGTGGSSKAIQFALKKMNIDFLIVSRSTKKTGMILYETLEEEHLKNYPLIVNCTPLGTNPEIDRCPNIPYQYLTDSNIVFDLIYNPSLTKMLEKAASKGAIIKNGYEMLTIQAEESWNIWVANEL